MKIDPSKHIFFTSSQEIDQIIQPLKDFFGITSFVYQKNFHDGSEIRLSNQPHWVHYFYENELYKNSFFEQAPSEFIKSRILWAGLTIHQPILKKARQFNIDHGITFVEPCDEGCEFFFIGTESNRPDVMTKYLSHLDLLEKFLIYFREKARPLIEKASKNKIFIPKKSEFSSSFILPNELNREAFLKKLHPIKFTNRELDCIRLLTKGYTQKMIAKELNLSPRTVETHLLHVKNKTSSNTKDELVKYLIQNII